MSRPRRPGTNRHVRNVEGHAIAQAKATMRGEEWDRHILSVDQRAMLAAADLWAVARYVTRIDKITTGGIAP
jgi:hypothetical protein